MKKLPLWFKTSVLIVLPISLLVGSSFLNNQKEQTNSNFSNLTKESNLDSNLFSTNKRSLGTVTETVSTFSFLPNSEISWANTKKAQNVTAADLTIAVTPANIDAVYKIEIQPPQNDDYLNGIVRFKIIQSIRTFTDGVVTSISYQEITAPSGSGTGTTWQTPAGLVVEDKYKFAWRSDSEIGDFLATTSLKPSELTPQIVLDNLILQDNLHRVPDVSNISVTASDLTSNSMANYGVTSLVVTFNGDGATATNWVGNTLPTVTERTITLRGLANSANKKEEMIFDATKLDATTFKALRINSAQKSIFGDVLLPTENTLGDLTPSELVNINNGNLNSLINLFTSGMYLETVAPIAGLYYMGSFTTDANFTTNTGLAAGLATITSIESEPNDLDGSLKLIFQYNYYNVYFNNISKLSYSHTFPAGTFRTNLDAEKTLSFDWKENSAVADTFGSSHSIVNQFKQLTSEEEKAAFSNQFFIGSIDAYAKIERTIEIDYKGGSKLEGGLWVPISTNADDQKQVEVSIYFHTWNGLVTTYKGNTVDGFATSQTFTLPTYRYTSGTVTWVNQSSLADLQTRLASDIAYDVGKNLISQTRFFSTSGLTNVSAVFLPDDTNGTLRVRVVGSVGASQQVYENSFVGFKQSTLGNDIVQIGWLPQTNITADLLDKGINNITKADVITLLSNSNNLFANAILTENDIELIPDLEKNVIVVKVNITFFNQDLPSNTQSQTFYTEIVGFSSTSVVDNTVIPTPVNITLIVSVAAGGSIALVLLSILIYQIVRSTRFSIAKKRAKAKEGE